MKLASPLRRASANLLSALQFLTRIPVPSPPYTDLSLARSLKFFPLVGALIGSGAALLHHLLVPHLSRPASAFLVLLYLVLITGSFHEDGLADTADGFGGGGSSPEKILLILRDSRIGSFGGVALALSLLGRLVLIASIPLDRVSSVLISAAVLSRWTTLPLSCFLAPARHPDTPARHPDNPPRRPDTPAHLGQGARIAQLTSPSTLISGTLFTFALVGWLLRAQSIAPILTSIALTLATGRFYKQRIGGITGDCFGATNQLTEIGVYLCGAWTR